MTAEPTPEVTPEPTPEATPSPTPEPTPSPTPTTPPTWREIVSQVWPWWQRLTVVGAERSVLRTVSYMAERYLVVNHGTFVQRDGRGSALSDLAADIRLLLQRV